MAQDVGAGEGKTPARLGQLDICRGLAILAVLFIHVSGHFLKPLSHPKSHAPLTWEWYALAVPNQDLQWAVPCFLMLSAFVNALSLARSQDLGRYAQRRLVTALLPYVLWSGVYIIVGHFLGTFHGLTPRHILNLLLNGTAYFHLYFFVLVLELYLLLPLIVPPFQRKPPFWAVALAAIALQVGIYGLNRYVFPHQFQATILWDTLPVALGLWLFSQSARLPEILTGGVWAAGAVTLAMLIVYTPIALVVLRAAPHVSVNTALYQLSEWGYTAGMSFLVLALAFALGQNRLTTLLSYFGAESLAIYAMHPLAIIALDRLGLNRTLGTASGFVVYYAACLALPLLAAWVWTQVKTSGARRRA